MKRSQRRKHRLLQRTEGVSRGGICLILPVLLLLVCGIMDFGNLYYQYDIANEAAREGARRLAINPSADVTTFIHTKLWQSVTVL